MVRRVKSSTVNLEKNNQSKYRKITAKVTYIKLLKKNIYITVTISDSFLLAFKASNVINYVSFSNFLSIMLAVI